MSSLSNAVVTRFAPSPTGFLHIGGARTALFNWLFARHHEGQFLLRIEDTDKTRSTQDAVDAILSGLSWLGLDWDGEPVSQSARAHRHQEVATALLSAGLAYQCFATPEENAAARETARSEGRSFLGDLWRDRDPKEAPAGTPYVIRFKMPREGDTVIEDAVQGSVRVQNATLDDLVILRADGSPTYMLSVVVDDHDMGITHVIRGDDHLNNSFKQVQIFRALNWDLPVFAHIPLIHGADGKKLSKRHGALGVEAYRDMGYIAPALRNYLMGLGWSFGEEDILTTKDAVSRFTLSALNKGAARFDFAKLDSINAHYLREMPAEMLGTAIEPFLETILQRPPAPEETARVAKAIPSLVERAKRLDDLADMATIFCNTRPLSLTDKAEKLVHNAAPDVLNDVHTALEKCADFEEDQLKQSLADVAAGHAIGLGKVMQPLRAVLTGGKPSGDLGEMMVLLGRNEVLCRIADHIGK